MSKPDMPEPQKGQKQEEQFSSSHGNHSPSVTPKDVSEKDAASKDLKERHFASRDEHEDELLDDAVDLTFPASDPISVSPPSRIEPDKSHRRGT